MPEKDRSAVDEARSIAGRDRSGIEADPRGPIRVLRGSIHRWEAKVRPSTAASVDACVLEGRRSFVDGERPVRDLDQDAAVLEDHRIEDERNLRRRIEGLTVREVEAREVQRARQRPGRLAIRAT